MFVEKLLYGILDVLAIAFIVMAAGLVFCQGVILLNVLGVI